MISGIEKYIENADQDGIKNLLKRLIDSARDAVFIIDDKGEAVFCNKTAENIFGFSNEELIGHDIHTLFLSPEQYTIFKTKFELYIKTGEGDAIDRIIRLTALTKKGDRIPIELSVSALNIDGKWFAAGIVRDISSRVEIEHLLKKEIALREMTEIELREAYDQSRSASRTKNLFLANMSHELRTPLNSIIGFSQLLEIQIDKLDTATKKEYISYIINSGNHLLQIVNDILNISKIESGNVSLDLTIFNLKELTNECIHEIESDINEKNLIMETDIDENTGFIKADRIKLRQIISNLLSNAVKFTSPGKKIGISIYPENTSAIIKVWDNGIGIAEEFFNDIFKSFEQVRNDISVKNHGTGLGLAIAKKLTELHSGTILVNSEPGIGSEFTVIIAGLTSAPKKISSENKNDMSIHSIKSGSIENKNILVVEDNLVNIKLIKTLLESAGYSVDTAETGSDGVNMALTEKYSIILMDIELPDISGIESMHRIKSSLKKHIPVIALTAHSMDGDREAMMKKGFDGYISKPINLKATLELLKNFQTNS